MLKIEGFYYHQECYTCSHCESNAVDCVSKDGKILWCQSCHKNISKCCFYCQTVFQPGTKRSIYKGNIICELCSNKVQSKRCFTCNTKIEDSKVTIYNL